MKVNSAETWKMGMELPSAKMETSIEDIGRTISHTEEESYAQVWVVTKEISYLESNKVKVSNSFLMEIPMTEIILKISFMVRENMSGKIRLSMRVNSKDTIWMDRDTGDRPMEIPMRVNISRAWNMVGEGTVGATEESLKVGFNMAIELTAK